jgi:hypothetical protein
LNAKRRAGTEVAGFSGPATWEGTSQKIASSGALAFQTVPECPALIPHLRFSKAGRRIPHPIRLVTKAELIRNGSRTLVSEPHSDRGVQR